MQVEELQHIIGDLAISTRILICCELTSNLDIYSRLDSSVWLYGALVNSSIVSVQTDESKAAVWSDTVTLPSSLAAVAFINPFNRRCTHILLITRILAWQGHVLPDVHRQLVNFFQGTICWPKKSLFFYRARQQNNFLFIIKWTEREM